jgi:hypothetical protein
MMQQSQAPHLQQRMGAQLRFILIDSDFEFTELLGVLGALGWGGWLLNPVWNSFSTTPSFAAMAALAPEWAWGAAVMLIGLAEGYGLLADVPILRKVTALLLTFVWASVGAMIAYANIAATGVVVYPLLAVSSGWAYLRLMARYRG